MSSLFFAIYLALLGAMFFGDAEKRYDINPCGGIDIIHQTPFRSPWPPREENSTSDPCGSAGGRR